MRRLLLASLSILALALAFHLGFRAADAQVPGQFAGITYTGDGSHPGCFVAVTATGEVWRGYMDGYDCRSVTFPDWQFWGSIYGTTATRPTTWGQVKGAGAAGK